MSLKGGTICVVRGCSSRTGGITSLFRFPKDPVRSECWLRSCNREDLLNISIDTLHKNYKICEKHFDAKYISKQSATRKHLFCQAVPTIFQKNSKKSLIIDAERDSDEPPKKNMIMSDEIAVPVEVQCNAIASPFEGQAKIVTCSYTIPQANFDVTGPTQSLDLALDSPIPSTSKELFSLSASTQTSNVLSSGTPRKQKLREKLKAARRKNTRKCVQKEEIGYSIEDFYKMCDTFLSEPLSGIVKAQAKLKNKKPLARRYSAEYKQFALTLYFLGPKAYQFMNKLLCLPTKRSLELMTQKLNFKPGLQNEAIFKSLELKSRTMLDQDRHCILCIDEMALKGNLYYHTGRDEIVGLHDVGSGTKEMLIAQNACVIMVRGLYHNWKQQIAYFFVNTQFCASDLRSVIEECILKLFNVGLYVDALVSDMGSNFVALSNILGVTPNNPEFHVGDQSVIYLFDTCHLIKATRNNLLNNVFYFNEKKTSWSFIDEFFQQDKKQTYRIAPKLSHSHIYPTNFEKMKVKYATQVLSNTVACGMSTYLSLGALPADAIATIQIIEKFDKLFDVLNASEKNHPNQFKNVFDGSDYQVLHLTEMRDLISNMKILNKSGKDVTSQSKFKNCWIVTINGIIKLWKKLEVVGFKYLRTRRVNQDAIENFFGIIRQQGGNCINPTPIQFERAFRKLFSQNFLHTSNMNCIEDFDELFIKIKSSDIIHTQEQSEPSEVGKSITLLDYDYRHENMPTQNAFNYVCGYLIKKSLGVHSCDICRNYSVESNGLDCNKLFTHFKAFDNEQSIYGGLRVPSENFVHYIFQLEKIFVSKFDELCKRNRISHLYFEEMKKVKYIHPCPYFPSMYVIKLFIRLKLFYTVKFSNKDIKTDKGKEKKHRKLTILSHL